MNALGQLPASAAEEVPDSPRPADGGPRAVSAGGWLFDAREFEEDPGSGDADLDAIITGLTSSAEACIALGFSYLPVMIPSKRNLINVTPSSDRAWVADLNARLRDVDDVELMSLFGVLRHARRHGRPYHRTDADWNDLGAFFVARALLKEARKTVPSLSPAPLADLHLRPLPGYRGTLIGARRFQLLGDELIECEADADPEDGIAIDASRLHARRMPVEMGLAQAGPAPVRIYGDPERDPQARIAVVGDAAALPVVVWLAERTRRTTLFCSRTAPLLQLEHERPPLVIHLAREADLRRNGWPSEAEIGPER
jgi:hypothetical protein